MDGGYGIAIEVMRRLGGIAAQGVQPDRAAVFPLPRAELATLLEAGAVRLRPILMTALSTVAGILPIAIGFGAGAESRRPLGIAVVGGMLTSTVLTLVVIPFVYTVFSELSGRSSKAKAQSSTEAPVENAQ